MFDDRSDAGKRLATLLSDYRGKNVIVLAIPRGGVEVGIEVARYLNAELSLLVTRKLPFPYNPEAGFGAVAEDGSTFIFPGAERSVPPKQREQIVRKQREEIARRVEVLRGRDPLPDLTDRTVILVDDGLAMGSTMRASIELCRKAGAGKVVVAVPVSGARTARAIDELADELYVAEVPPYFRAVAQVYGNWYDVSDGEVLELLKQWRDGS
ncbi:phosphoribosyltransferase [Candidatus Fermentibacteria bacterium]|nr:phosphoribosyltransferase [Candidatus Fermentibacteria bacterium]